MVKFNSFSVAALLACLVAVNAAGFNPFQDEQGKPCPPCATTRELNLVCGNNGRTYANPSVLKCHGICLKSDIKPKHYGPCHAGDLLRKVEENPCSPCVTTADYKPVCGTNGITYPNKSALRCDAKCEKSNIEIKHQGECA